MRWLVDVAIGFGDVWLHAVHSVVVEGAFDSPGALEFPLDDGHALDQERLGVSGGVEGFHEVVDKTEETGLVLVEDGLKGKKKFRTFVTEFWLGNRWRPSVPPEAIGC